MAIITPQTDLVLLQCPLEPDQQNQLTFANATAQYNYFNSLPKIPVNNFTYQRKDNTVRFPAQVDDIRQYNYCMYRNDAYSNKWFYAFITDIKYVNDGMTQFTLLTDVWQSWQFDLTFKRSFVEREHANVDTIGSNTLDEGLPIGEPIMNYSHDWIVASNSAETQRFVMQLTELPLKIEEVLNNQYPNLTSRVYNGIPQGCFFCAFRRLSSAQKLIKWYDQNDKAGAILSIFLVPANMVANATWATISDISGISGDIDIGFLPSSYLAWNMDLSGQTPVTYSPTLDGYTPKNKKMYCYPYSYLYVSNNAGSDVIYHYEDWQDPTQPYFAIRGTIGQGCNIQMYPYAYKRQSLTSGYGGYGISCAKLPIISWISDYYLNWQAQNAVNNVVKAGLGVASGMGTLAGGVMSTASGLASGSSSGTGHGIIQATGGVIDIISSINTAIHENYVADLVPNQAQGNTNCADLTYSMGKCGFTFRKMSCRREYAEMIDNYFSMFGYKTNKLKLPNIYGRSNWNFVKTRVCNIIGNIPQDDIEEIKSLFNSGITFWHNPATYLDYSQNNTIV